LVRQTFSDYHYRNLEDPEQREWAATDPRGFLSGIEPKIIDEVQRVPALLSYIQVSVDQNPSPGRYILTGSQSFSLSAVISQSLAGRVSLLTLLPFSFVELMQTPEAPSSLNELLFSGCYPPIYDRHIAPRHWLSDYISTYLDRDVRQLTLVKDLATFQRFLGLAAGWVGQLLNYSSLATDAGIAVNTVKSWLGLLEAAGLVSLLQPHHQNFRKRLVKTPKLYWLDTGLCCRLLGIQEYEQLSTHPMRGALFESWVVSELLKGRYNRGERSNLNFWRDHLGIEVDILCDHGQTLLPIEIKSGASIASDWFSSLVKWRALADATSEPPILIHGGDTQGLREGIQLLPWNKIADLASRI
jgi:predicted AAA+ superfamily ATPase